jgi:hypothetical protein
MLAYLIVPNLLAVNDYSQTVFVSVLLSFLILSDFGIASVYNRHVPGLIGLGRHEEIEQWNISVFWFRLVLSVVFSAVICTVYFVKYGSLVNAFALFLLAPFNTITSFYISKYNAQSDFKMYRKLNSFQSILKLSVIPFVYLSGITGWFLSQSLSAAATIGGIKERVFPGEFSIDFKLIKANIMEGLVLVALTFCWLQLLGAARLFASFYYPATVIAQYGLLNSGYQMILSLIISAFMPFTVRILKTFPVDEQESVDLVFKYIYLSIPVMALVVIAVAMSVPYLMERIFPRYHVDFFVIRTLVLSLVVCPIMATVGNLFICKKKSILYVLLTAGMLLACWLIAVFLEPRYGFRSASIAQTASILVYAFLEIALALYLFRNRISGKIYKASAIFGAITLFCLGYSLIFLR